MPDAQIPTDPTRATGMGPDAWLRDPDVLAWMDAHADTLRKSATGQRLVYWSLASAFIVGLIAHVVGFEIRPSAPRGPLALAADLLYSLGWALWTGVVVTLFVQIIPDLKRRQISRSLEAYDALRARNAGR